jgi:hypothetical protein
MGDPSAFPMLRKPKRKHILAILLIASLIGAGWAELSRGSQYRLGMSLAEVRALSGNRYPTQRWAIGERVPPTQQERIQEPVCYMYDDDSGVVLYFNYYQVLIQKEKIKYFGVNVLDPTFRRSRGMVSDYF